MRYADPPMHSFEIRPARLDDAASVAVLAAAMAQSYAFDQASFDLTFPKLIDSADGDTALLVATDGGTCIGYLLGFRHLTFYANGPVASVEEIFVRADYRQRGVGRDLMAALERWATAAHCALVSLATRRAEPFYRALGYAPSAAYLRRELP
jgi:GNAT superfamily N-acetyltransferase